MGRPIRSVSLRWLINQRPGIPAQRAHSEDDTQGVALQASHGGQPWMFSKEPATQNAPLRMTDLVFIQYAALYFLTAVDFSGRGHLIH